MDWYSSERFSYSVIRCLLFLFNIVFQIAGIILICVGILTKKVFSDYKDLLDDRYVSSPTLLISAGVIIFFIACFGCCGVLKRNHCMVFTYSVFLGAIFVMEIVAGVTGYVLSDDASEILNQSLNRTMYSYNAPNSTTIKTLWDGVQNEFKCCGIKNYTEWQQVLGSPNLPLSCCTIPAGSKDSFCNASSPTLHKIGCVDELSNQIETNALTLGSVAFGAAFIQLIGIIFACCLAKSIKETAYESV